MKALVGWLCYIFGSSRASIRTRSKVPIVGKSSFPARKVCNKLGDQIIPLFEVAGSIAQHLTDLCIGSVPEDC